MYHEIVNGHRKSRKSYCIDQNAAIVPHAAMMTPVTSRNPSQKPQRRARAIFAEMGPMTHSKNEENAPRKAIMEENSGTKIDTTTEHSVNKARSTAVKMWFNVRPPLVLVTADSMS